MPRVMSKIKSSIIASALNKTYTYLSSEYTNHDVEMLKEKLLMLVGIESFDFEIDNGKQYSYETLQEILSKINEKDATKKSKGIYYTPCDVVRFIAYNTIKCSCNKLYPTGLRVLDLNGIPYITFCTNKSVFDPTCGTGEFLLAILDIKFNLIDNHAKKATESIVRKIISTKSPHPHFKWGFEFNPSGVLYWFRLGRGFAAPLIPVAANGG